MRRTAPLLAQAALLAAVMALAGCISYSSAPPSHTVVQAPPGSTVVCTNGNDPPC